jgi:hypothetical protein
MKVIHLNNLEEIMISFLCIDISFCDQTSEEIIEKCEQQICHHENCIYRIFSQNRISDMFYDRNFRIFDSVERRTGYHFYKSVTAKVR